MLCVHGQFFLLRLLQNRLLKNTLHYGSTAICPIVTQTVLYHPWIFCWSGRALPQNSPAAGWGRGGHPRSVCCWVAQADGLAWPPTAGSPVPSPAVLSIHPGLPEPLSAMWGRWEERHLQRMVAACHGEKEGSVQVLGTRHADRQRMVDMAVQFVRSSFYVLFTTK